MPVPGLGFWKRLDELAIDDRPRLDDFHRRLECVAATLNRAPEASAFRRGAEMQPGRLTLSAARLFNAVFVSALLFSAEAGAQTFMVVCTTPSAAGRVCVKQGMVPGQVANPKAGPFQPQNVPGQVPGCVEYKNAAYVCELRSNTKVETATPVRLEAMRAVAH